MAVGGGWFLVVHPSVSVLRDADTRACFSRFMAVNYTG
jgi:hypothetical protein